jgi:hypothetical protein
MNLNDKTKRFTFDWLKWFGLYIGIGIVLVLVLPFPYDLVSVYGLCILINFLRGRSTMKRYRGIGGMGGIKDMFESHSSSVSGNDQQGPLKYYCMICGMEHKEISCPYCGSKMKRVG